MARPQLKPTPLNLPPEINPDVLPRYGTAEQFQEIATFYWGPTSARVIRSWDLPWRAFNGRLVAPTSAFLAEMQRRFDATPPLNCGKERTPAAVTVESQA